MIYSNEAETETANDAEMLLLKDGADAERVITAEEDGADAWCWAGAEVTGG